MWASFTRATETQAMRDALDWKEKAKPTSGRTFEQAARAYNNAKEPYISPTTFRGYESIRKIISECFPRFARKSVIAITPADVQDLIDEFNSDQPPRHRLQKEPRKLSPKSIKNYIGYVIAVLEGRIALNSLSFPKRVQSIAVPSDDEIGAILKATEGTSVYVPVLLACFGPLRRGEIAALTSKDIKDGIVSVQKDTVRDSKGEWIVKPYPKTEASVRRVELPESVLQAIDEYGLPHLTPDAISAKFQRALKKAGLPPYRFHALRHWSASSMHAQGIPDAYIMARGGWSTDSTLKAVYRHTLQDRSEHFSRQALQHFDSLAKI